MVRNMVAGIRVLSDTDGDVLSILQSVSTDRGRRWNDCPIANRVDKLEHVMECFEAAECQFVQIEEAQTSWDKACKSAQVTIEGEGGGVGGRSRSTLLERALLSCMLGCIDQAFSFNPLQGSANNIALLWH